MSIVVIPDRWGLRGGTAADLATVNEIPMKREAVIEDDTGLIKIGDGVTHYNSLSYVSPKLNQKQILARKSATAGRAEACSLSELLDFVGSAANGDLLYRSGGAWTRLPISSNGNVLSVVSGAPAWAAAGSGGGNLTYVAEAVVTGSAATTLGLTGIDLNTDQEYQLIVSVKNASASSANFSMYYNADTTDANYKRSYTTNTGSGTENNARLGAFTAGEVGYLVYNFKMDINGRPLATFMANRYTTSPALTSQFQAVYWTTASNLTQLTLSSSVASALAVGTKMTLYKRAH